MGATSCYSDTISQITGNVYAYGYYSMVYSNMSNISGNIYCVSQACQYTNINVVNGNVIGSGFRALYYSTLSQINGTVLGYSKQTLFSTTMTNVLKVRNAIV